LRATCFTERTPSGIEIAEAEGKKFARPSAPNDLQKSDVLRVLAEGASIAPFRPPVRYNVSDIMRMRAAERHIPVDRALYEDFALPSPKYACHC